MEPRLVVTPEALAILRLTEEQIGVLTLGEFCNLVFDRGYDIRVTSHKALEGKGKLTVRADTPQTPPMIPEEKK